MVTGYSLPPLHPKKASPAGSAMLTARLPAKPLDFIGSLLQISSLPCSLFSFSPDSPQLRQISIKRQCT